MTEALRLNLGAGNHPIEGYINLDGKTGNTIFPLDHPDLADEIRASHVLEHFPHAAIVPVLQDWARTLRPGGIMKIAVPDFARIVDLYREGYEFNVQGVMMGGQVDEADYHKTIFDKEALTEAMRAAGLLDIRPWTDDVGDCASLPISLNLMGRKPTKEEAETARAGWKIGAVMSVPRLGFMDNMTAAFEALPPLGIKLRKVTGAFWGQCLERGITQFLDEGVDAILTVDYDTVYTRADVAALIETLRANPSVDALAPIQARRTEAGPLAQFYESDLHSKGHIDRDLLAPDVRKVRSAHFGLTLIRAEAFTKLKRPWFWSTPGKGGSWERDSGKADDDIYFWQRFEHAGLTLALANRITVGHAELMVRWLDVNMDSVFQHPSDFWKTGKPDEVWR